MKHLLIAIFTLALLGAVVAVAFSADAGRKVCRERRMGKGMACADAKAPTVTISGAVQGITTGQPGPALLTMTAGEDSHRVMVGPASYLSTLKLPLKSGDQITITGWPITCQEKAVVIVRELTLAGTTYTLRDASGKPVWAGTRCSGTATCDPAACRQNSPATTCDECPMNKEGSSCRRSGGRCGSTASDSTTSTSSSDSQ